MSSRLLRHQSLFRVNAKFLKLILHSLNSSNLPPVLSTPIRSLSLPRPHSTILPFQPSRFCSRRWMWHNISNTLLRIVYNSTQRKPELQPTLNFRLYGLVQATHPETRSMSWPDYKTTQFFLSSRIQQLYCTVLHGFKPLHDAFPLASSWPPRI